jgi:hypothetical protein
MALVVTRARYAVTASRQNTEKDYFDGDSDRCQDKGRGEGD